MKKILSWWSISLALMVFVVLVVINSGCDCNGPTPGFTSSKVIVSHVGEVTQDVRAVGEVIKYKVYFSNNSKQQADIVIMDKLDTNLSQITVFNNGMYDEQDHYVIWEIGDVPVGEDVSVEFEAVIGKAKLIRNQATIQINGQRDIQTNTVETTVCGSPELGWVPFDRVSKSVEVPRSAMKDETTMGTTVNFDIPGMFVHEVKVNGVIYHRLSIPGHTTLLDLGKPELPIVGQIIEVPHGVNFDIEVIKSASIPLECYNVYPAQEREIRQGPPEENEFALDETAYLTDDYYPAELAVIEAGDIGVIRGHRIVFLKVNPIQYNPVTRESRAFTNIEVRLNYDKPAQIQPVDARIKSQAFEELIQRSVLNYKDPGRFAGGDARDGSDRKEDGCDYLIITHGDFYNANDANNPVVRLQNWKQQKGYKTRVVDVADIPGGNTADDIRDYIQDAYDQWYPVPTYVLLVGDADFIPTNYQVDQVSETHPSHNNTFIGSDLYYVTVDGVVTDGGNVLGPDYFPDMFIGRLSVETLAEAEDIVDKMLAYEQNPPANANYYTDTALVCLFEDAMVNGQEDATFRIIEFSEEIEDYLDTNGYDPERIYDQSGNWAAGPQRYENGTNIPVLLTIAGGFPWNGATVDITNAINNGNFLIIYDGHGAPQWWDLPFFDDHDADALANDNPTPVLPIILSYACQTGWFDHETDDPSLNATTNSESLCEHFFRHSTGGAVGVIGSTRISWDNNDFMMLGATKAIWPDFDPNPPFGPGQLPDIQTGPLVRMGQINTFSKVYMANYYNDDFHRQASFEMYTLFGDPEMPVWTEEPANFDVDHPEGIGSTGEQDFVVKVYDGASGDPVQSAVVVLTRDSTILATKQTNPGGIVRFTLMTPGTGDLDITVTALNYRPYQGNIVVNAGGADLNRLDPEDGVENQTIHVGGQNFSGNEKVDIYLGDQLMKTQDVTGGNFGQSGVEDVDIKVPSPYDLGPVNILAHGQTSDRYAVDVFQVRTTNPIDVYTYSQWDNTTWHLQTGGDLTWNNPEIKLYDTDGNPVASNNLVVGTQYTIQAEVHNDTNFDANNVKVAFKWANFGLGQPDRVWEDIGTDEVNIPANNSRKAEIEWTPPSTGHLCMLVEIYHIEDINESNNKGQENLHVGPASSPADVCFAIWNPTKEPAYVFLELRQLVPEGQELENPLWGSWIMHPDPQLIKPGEMTKGCVLIDPDYAGIKRGKAEFVLTGYINGKIIGGVNFIIEKK